jgi:hypothetical protein
MAVRSCRVTIQDLEGIAHTVEVTAETLYEAVAQRLAALRRSDWVHGFQQGTVKVSVADVRVEHQEWDEERVTLKTPLSLRQTNSAYYT